MTETIRLVVRRRIATTPERLFEAWTTPEHLQKWWGPPGVRCTTAEVDLRVGGQYRLENRFPDGRSLWITGHFERIAPPRELIYTWGVEPAASSERVTVRFEDRDGATEVVVVHERIGTETARNEHEAGWRGCLDGLAKLLT